MSKEEVEDFFYNGKLRINKKRTGKRYSKVRFNICCDYYYNLNNFLLYWKT